MVLKKEGGKKMNKRIIFFIGNLLIYFIAFAQTPTNDPHWQLKWEDQFNNFNSSKWLIGKYGDHYGEPQLYLETNVQTFNGNLVIKISNYPVRCPNPAPSQVGEAGTCTPEKLYQYTSGWIETKEAYKTQYGYIEARIKLPFKRVGNKSWGFWPAFWTFSSGATNAAEIDIFEMFGGEYKEPNTLNTCIHRHYDFNEHMGCAHTFANFDYTEWHTYAIEWNANRIIWYLDGKAIRTTCNHQIIGPIRIILNLAIQSQSKYYPPTSPPFTAYMYVDYVKVYCLQCDKSTPLTINNLTDLANYDYKVKKSITINPITIPAGNNICLRANDFIELKPGFEVQTGREMYLDVTPCEPCIPIAQEIPRGGGE